MPPPKNEGILDKLRRLGFDVEKNEQDDTLQVQRGNWRKTTVDDVFALASLGNLSSVDLSTAPISERVLAPLQRTRS